MSEQMLYPKTDVVIGACAFKNCKSIKSLNGLKNVKVVQDNAFRGCSSLVSIDIPNNSLRDKYDLNSYVKMGKNVFEDCPNLAKDEGYCRD